MPRRAEVELNSVVHNQVGLVLDDCGFLASCHASGESCFGGLASCRKHSTLASLAVKHMPNMAVRIL